MGPVSSAHGDSAYVRAARSDRPWQQVSEFLRVLDLSYVRVYWLPALPHVRQYEHAVAGHVRVARCDDCAAGFPLVLNVRCARV